MRELLEIEGSELEPAGAPPIAPKSTRIHPDPPLIEALTRIAEGGREWLTAGVDTTVLVKQPGVQAALADPAFIPTNSADSANDAITIAVETALEDLPTPYSAAGLDYFGFTSTGKPRGKDAGQLTGPGLIARRARAASHLEKGERWFRDENKQFPYSGRTPARFIVDLVAQKLVDPEPAVSFDIEDAGRRLAEASVSQHRGAGGKVETSALDGRYVEMEPDQFRKAFWGRASTERYRKDITELATTQHLTIYAGADGFADVGQPLHRALVASILTDCLSDHRIVHQHIEDKYRSASDERRRGMRNEYASRIAKAIMPPDMPPEFFLAPAYPGSIARGLYSLRTGTPWSHVENRLHTVINDPTDHRSDIDTGFVGRAIALLALTLKTAGTHPVVVTAHYDDDILKAPQQSPLEFSHLHGAAFAPSVNTVPNRSESAGEVPLIRLHGDPGGDPGQIVVGEADLFGADPRYADDNRRDGPGHKSRIPLLEELLTTRPVLFVGTALTDAGLIATLGKARGQGPPRYALLVAPPTFGFASADSRDEATRLRDRALYLEALAARYLHLGVIPVIADFPYQVPQFLREIALGVDDDDYETHHARVDKWWTGWSPSFGYNATTGAQLDPLPSRDAWKKDWCQKLKEHTADIVKPEPSERLKVELWIRNPITRTLFLWASTERRRPDEDDVPTASLLAEGDVTQETFREGRTMWSDITEGRWRGCLSMHLVSSPRRDLDPKVDVQELPIGDAVPIGVIKILSTQPRRGLYYVAHSADAPRLERRVRALFVSQLRLLDELDRASVSQ